MRVDDLAWHSKDWELAGEGSVSDARTRTRGQAVSRYVSTAYSGCWTDVGAWKRHLRFLTLKERWEHEYDGSALPPDGWYPSEYTPAWAFCARTHPEAIPVWIVGERLLGPPPSPVIREFTGGAS